MKLDHACPICQGESVHERLVPDWGEMRHCAPCRLVFANPMTLPESPESLFTKAYEGLLENTGMESYGQRIKLKKEMKDANVDSDRTRVYGAYIKAMAWLKANVPRGSVVLDIGCGVGHFLADLHKNGFTPVGLDVAEGVVEMLRDEGFEVWHGTIESVPPNWQQPVVCSSFFVMHHLQDPVGFLTTIRNKFPKATLLIAAWNQYPSPQQFSAASLPPRSLAWWGKQSLRKAMEKAGYQIEFVSEPLGPSEFEMPWIIRRLFSRKSESWWNYRLLTMYRSAKPVVFWPLKLWKRLRGRPNSVLALGKPC